MCVIIDRPAGVVVDEGLLLQGMGENQDGWGIMFSDGGEIQYATGMDPEDFWSVLPSVPDDVHATIHFRYATHGVLSEANCHPFVILDGEYAVMHNGVISVAMPKGTRHSDTWHWANERLARHLELNPARFDDWRLRGALEKSIGSYNKVVVMRRDGERMYLNRAQGVDYDGLWLSNSGPLRGIGWGRSEASTWTWAEAEDDWLVEMSGAQEDMASAVLERPRLRLERRAWESVDLDDDWFVNASK